ncbi:MAG: sulfurtransferase [Gammaproteobacteria bacterium HGW-Gammaproteobacteria-3]|nr:MAG: sulfurtransferase [Gammaproteobacteria bacterium HGW-Gammaproteobacteria-3]
MTYTTILSAETLARHLNDSDWVIFDCRFDLADTEAGAKAYRFGHIANARYAHLDRDLSSAVNDFSGRHPLPDFKLLSQKLGRWGVDNASQVIVYDDAGGAIAGRMWWLLRCLGHSRVAVLDGGIRQWLQQGYPVTTTLPTPKAAAFRAYLDKSFWLDALAVQNGLARNTLKLVDARTPVRYRGEQEPVDPVAGRVPGALNRAFQCNLDLTGQFKSAELLRGEFSSLLGTTEPQRIAHMCGSGVTACHNVLAMEIAGLKGSRLYAGSWSEWIRNKNRPVAKSG